MFKGKAKNKESTVKEMFYKYYLLCNEDVAEVEILRNYLATHPEKLDIIEQYILKKEERIKKIETIINSCFWGFDLKREEIEILLKFMLKHYDNIDNIVMYFNRLTSYKKYKEFMDVFSADMVIKIYEKALSKFNEFSRYVKNWNVLKYILENPKNIDFKFILDRFKDIDLNSFENFIEVCCLNNDFSNEQIKFLLEKNIYKLPNRKIDFKILNQVIKEGYTLSEIEVIYQKEDNFILLANRNYDKDEVLTICSIKELSYDELKVYVDYFFEAFEIEHIYSVGKNLKASSLKFMLIYKAGSKEEYLKNYI